MKDQTTSKLITRLFGTALIAAVVLGGKTFAASPLDDAPSAVVKFADLNLDTPQGVSALYRRIHNAAEQVCGVVPEDRVFIEAAIAQGKCVRESEVRAIDAVNNVALQAYYSKKTGRAMPLLASNQTK